MPAAVAIVGAVAGGIGAAAGGIAGFLGGALSTLGGAVVSAIGTAASAIGSAVGSVASAIGSAVGSVASAIGSAVAPLVESVSSAIATVGEGISTTLSSAGKALWSGINSAVAPVVDTLKGGIEIVTGAIDTVTAPVLTPIKDGLSLVAGKLEAIDAWVATQLTPVHDLIQIISAANTVKLLIQVIKGQARVNELIEKIAESESLETAAAIAELSKNITSLSVGIVDKVDNTFSLLATEIETWDEQFKSELDAALAVEKAELMATVTPRLDTLGAAQTEVIGRLAAVSRHMEDQTWFAWMFLRMLR